MSEENTTEPTEEKSSRKARTSLTIDVDLFEWVKNFAKAKKVSVSAVINDAIQNMRDHNAK
mgnify:CR=1 FL=1